MMVDGAKFGIICQQQELLRKATLQMFAGNYRDSTGKSECRDFKFMGIACIPAIPVIFKYPQSVIFAGNLIYRDSTGIPRIRCRENM